MRFEALNIFRFFAAIIIIFFHFHFPSDITYKNTNFHVPGIFFDGPNMVTFFFVLSGFVMTLAYYNQGNGLLLGRNYWLNRVSRIYPVYLFALLLTIIAFEINRVDFPLILNLALLQAWFPQYVMAINGPAWAISVEMFFYATFPIILFYLKRRDYNPYHIILMAFFFWLFTQIVLTILLNSRFYGGAGSFSHEYIYHFPLPHLCSFILGIAGGYFIIKKQYLLQLPNQYSYGFLFLVIVGVFYIIGSWGVFQQLIGFRVPIGASFFGPLFLLFILSVAMINNTYIGKILSNRLLLLLGASSYAIYILQQPINKLLYKFVLPFPGISEARNLLIFLIIEIAFSIIAFYIIEGPGKTILRNIFQEETRAKSWWMFWK